ncbi:MAG TPA: helix-turn-helix domain-containing protein [Xanthobacteraceae bacterium]|jgi:HTH-type transcriptional regulator/antitoxin HipB|nr:helix-turn-helix domain-containing protein [Xanthobacteraceae bacterium]
MLIRTPTDLGAVVRDTRKQLKLDQATLAKRIGVSRQWVVEVERGHSRAPLGLVLRALDALNIQIDVKVEPTKRRSSAIDIDAIVAKAKKR